MHLKVLSLAGINSFLRHDPLILGAAGDALLQKLMNDMSNIFWLTDAQMAVLALWFPKSHGKPRVDDQRVLSGTQPPNAGRSGAKPSKIRRRSRLSLQSLQSRSRPLKYTISNLAELLLAPSGANRLKNKMYPRDHWTPNAIPSVLFQDQPLPYFGIGLYADLAVLRLIEPSAWLHPPNRRLQPSGILAVPLSVRLYLRIAEAIALERPAFHLPSA